jgi:hypothetical protein
MSQDEELAFIRGERMAYRLMLRECLRGLGYDNSEANKANWVVEREGAIETLRQLCKSFGDNDWPDTLNLSDIIDKHLAKYLYKP